MKKLTLVILAMVAGLGAAMEARAAVGDVFVRNGMRYTVTSESPKEAELTTWEGTKPTGTLTILNYAEGYNVTSIGKNAFTGCSELAKVVIQNGIRSIGNGAFSDIKMLYSISIPESVTSIGGGAFTNCEHLYDINIPSGVKVIEPETFLLCQSLTSITLPEGLTSIGADAFQYCRALTSITIPDKVKIIGDRAFLYCLQLATVTIGSGVTSIGKGAFVFASVSDVFMNADPKTLDWDLSGDYDGAGDLILDFLPDAATRIHIPRGSDWSAYIGKVNAKFCYYPAYALNDEFSVGKVTYRVTSLDPATVEVCGSPNPSGAIVILPVVGQYAVTAIAGSAFEYYDQLTAVTIPESVTFIDREAFHGCTGITDVYCYADPTKLTWDDGDCDDFKDDGSTVMHVRTGTNWTSFIGKVHVTFSSDLVSGVNDGFYLGNLYYLVTSVSPKTVQVAGHTNPLSGALVIPADANGWAVTDIESNVFHGCSQLTSVTIPETVTEIGVDAFLGCTGITDVYMYADPTKLTWDEHGKDDFKTDGSTLCHVLDAAAWQEKFGTTVNVTFVQDLDAVVLDDATPYTQIAAQNVASVTYRKTVAPANVGKHIAWMLPFPYTLKDADLEKFTFYRLSLIINAPAGGKRQPWVFLEELPTGTQLLANTPYVYKAKEAVTDYAFTTENALMVPRNEGILRSIQTTEANYYFYGTFDALDDTPGDPFHFVVEEGDAATVGTIRYVEYATVRPFRWFIRPIPKTSDVFDPVIRFFDGQTVTIGIRGDVNQDGVVSITDAVSVVNIILGQ